MFMKIMFIVLVVLLFFIACFISYIFGMIKGYKNLMSNNEVEWGKFDTALYENLSQKKKKDFEDTVVSRVAEIRMQEFKDKKKIEKRLKDNKKIKEINKEKFKNKSKNI